METHIQLIKKFIPVNKVGDVSNKGNRYLSVSCMEAIKVKHRNGRGTNSVRQMRTMMLTKSPEIR